MDQLKSLITSLGSLNSRETEAALLVDWIMERWEEIKKEVNDFNKPKDAKRRTFGKKEGELVDWSVFATTNVTAGTGML